MVRLAGICIMIFLGALHVPARAAPPILEISGNISRFNDGAGKVYRINGDQWNALPQSSIRTATTWTPRATFTGVKMTTLLALVGAKGGTVEFQALDDYISRIPTSDFARFHVILAGSMDGKLLQTSDFGPYFLVYPRDDFPALLRSAGADAKFVWQVTRINVK